MQTAFNFFFVLICIQLLQHDVTTQQNNLLLLTTLGSMMAINWIGSIWLKTNSYRWILPLVSIVLLGWFGKNQLYYDNDYPLDFSNIQLISILFIGWGVSIIAYGIQQLISPFFHTKDESLIAQVALLILLGFATIFATFFASWYGILLLAIGLFLYHCFSRTKNDYAIVSLLLIASIGPITSIHALEVLDLTLGKIIAGILIGCGSYMLGVLALKSVHPVAKIVLLFLSIIILITIALLNLIHPAYGGIESLLSAWVAIAIAHLILQNNHAGRIFFPVLLTLGLLISNQQESIEKNTAVAPIEQESVLQEPTGKNIDLLKGKYRIDAQSAIISFQLGQKGSIVKGSISHLEGTVHFTDDIQTTQFSVTIPTNKLTTHNSMRDKTVLGEKYLNTTLFPTMTFVSDAMQQHNDGYILSGQFTLLGVSLPQEVFIKYIDKQNDKQKLIGKGIVEHAKFGVPASPQEKKGVEFTFEIELSQY